MALAEMCFARGFGAQLTFADEVVDTHPKIVSELFSESNSRFLMEVENGEQDKFEKMLRGFPFTKIGTVSKDRILMKNESGKKFADVSTKDAYAAWKSTFGGR